ncbi:restriction endonuclease subunit S [Vibrio cholerae]|uniref:restriction endonuclease subunit S n=1 Tax=Vibrio cholerae TaxID=666 RepID=UPI0011591EFC|nr:restriction endonuclease subunit S [Vibrio cholerae]TQP18464.1 restriction endonuclease subunit S [Vibrio cholerae]TQP31768.1 restriction endonuclease subunit S [Vibrio cholerae]
MSQHKTTPKLRFQEFSTSWALSKLGDFYSFKNGINADRDQYGSGAKFINVLDVLQQFPITYESIQGKVDVNEKVFDKNAVTKGDLLFQRSSETREDVGTSNVYISNEPVTFGGFVIRGKPKLPTNPLYMNYLLKSSKARKEITEKSGGSTRYNVGQETLSAVNLYVSTDKQEQQKIADFLTAVDTKINQLTEKHRLLKEYKKGVMQQIFSQQLRFKDKDGKAFPEWEEKHFGEVFGRVTQKNSVNNLNVLTISAQKGLISQLEYFNKSVSAKDVSGYYLLRKGDFAYNKSYSQGYPMGAIKPLKFYDSGVVSTLYICFRPKKGFEEAYFEQFFDAGMLNREIAKIAQEGARNHGLLNVSVKEFFDDIKLLVPHQNEQQKIAQFLQALDSKIAAVSQQIEQTKQFKKGLLQQMFV